MKEVDEQARLIAKLILTRLDNIDKWGGAHSELNRVIKSLPSHVKETHKGKKQVNKAIKLLLNLRFLFMKMSTVENITFL